MDEGPVKSVLDILPAYLNFFIGFTRSPHAAFAPYARTGRVEGKLTSCLLAGVAAAYIAGAVMPSASLDIENPQGGMDRFARWIVHQDVKTLPLEALLAVLALALAAHLIGKFFDLWREKPSLPGKAEDTVNAALGFASVFLPVTVMVLLGMLSLGTPALAARFGQSALVLTIASVLVAHLIAAAVYLVLSFAAVHRVSRGAAISVLGTAFVCLAVVAIIAGNIN
jgi:hypothetical protein